MLRARPGRYRVSDFQAGGRPDLSWYNEFYRYQHTVYGDLPGLVNLLVPDGVKNAGGNVIIKQEEVKPKNELKNSSNWFIEADSAKPPVISGDSVFIRERQNDLSKIIVEMSTIGHVVGHGIIYVAANQIYLVWGTNILPMQVANQPIPGGWGMVWPYYRRDPNNKSSRITDASNRIKVTWYQSPEQQETNTFRFSGEQIQDLATDPEIVRDPPIQYLQVFGVDEGFYPEGIKIAGEIARLDAVIRELTTTYGFPVPIVSPKVGRSTSEGHLLALNGDTIMVPTTKALVNATPNAPPLEFAIANAMVDESMAERLEWRKKYHATVRIPMEITENRDDQMSGVSRALLAQPTVDRIESMHRQITEALDGAIRTITGRGITDIEWPRQPFDTLAERRVIAENLYNAGLITLNEARAYVDLEPIPGGDTFKTATTAEGDEQDARN